MANRDFGRGGNRDRDYGEPYGRGGYSGRPYGGAGREENWGAESGREGYPRQGYGREEDPADRERFDRENFGNYGGLFGPGYYLTGGWGRESGRESYFGRGPRGYRRSDERIREDISDRLTWHPAIDASDVEVGVENAEVTLTGVVEDRRAKRLAADIADEVMGVEDVHNQLKVRHGFLASLTGERAEEREVSLSAERESTEATGRRGTRTGATTGTTGGT